jgi:hypothetical protein
MLEYHLKYIIIMSFPGSFYHTSQFTLHIHVHWSSDDTVGWLWWGDTDVSELRSLWAYCSSPGDCDVDHGKMVSTGTNSYLVYQSAQAVTSTLAVLSAETSLERVGEWAKEMII